MDLAAFDYHLRQELIAQQPLADRARRRMLVVYRDENRLEDRLFRELPEFLHPVRLPGGSTTRASFRRDCSATARAWQLAGRGEE